MRVFVTGASGWIGSAVVPELIGAGHQVVGLARSDASAETVAACGAEVLIGDVQDVDVLRAGAEQADGVVHLAFRHDIAWTGQFEEAAASDRRAIEVFGDVLSGTDGPLAVASGIAGVRPGGIATERDLPSDGVSPRVASERAVLALAERGVRSMSLRFAPTVHGVGDHGFIARIVDADRSHGAAGYVAEGENRWAAVHRRDAAQLVRLGIEHAPAGSVLHAVGEEGVAMRDIAEAIGHRFELPATAISQEEAGERFGFLAQFVGLDMAASSAITRQLLGWEPTGPTLIEDISAGAYSNGSRA
jgi:nucleoside-diphosphate-sugar epimerase